MIRGAMRLALLAVSLPVFWGCVDSAAGSGTRQGTGRVLAVAPFTVAGRSEDYVLTVSQDSSKEGAPVRRISLSREGHEIADYSQETPDGFLGFLPSNGDWIGTLWETGSAMVLRVYGLSTSGPGVLFEKPLQMTPELIDVDGDGRVEVLITSGRILVSGDKTLETPTGCEIYRWDGSKHRFERIGQVSWKERLRLLRGFMK